MITRVATFPVTFRSRSSKNWVELKFLSLFPLRSKVQSSSLSAMTWRNLSLAVSAAGLLILVRSGGWLCAVGTPLSLATACLISNGHTRLSGLSMWCPLWSNDNPRTTPSFPRMCRATFPFFHYPRFLSSPTFNTISLISGAFGVLRVIRWVSIRLWIY